MIKKMDIPVDDGMSDYDKGCMDGAVTMLGHVNQLIQEVRNSGWDDPLAIVDDALDMLERKIAEDTK